MFNSKYLLKQQAVQMIPTISSKTSNTEMEDESNPEVGDQLHRTKISITGASTIENIGDIETEVDYEPSSNSVAFITKKAHQMTGDDHTTTETDGRVPTKREYANRVRTTPKESFPFATYEDAEDNNYIEIDLYNRRLVQVDLGISKAQECIDNLEFTIANSKRSKTKELVVVLDALLAKTKANSELLIPIKGKTVKVTFDLLTGDLPPYNFPTP